MKGGDLSAASRELAAAVRRGVLIKRGGVAAGAAILSASLAVGLDSQLLDPLAVASVVAPTAAAIVGARAYEYVRTDERRAPMPTDAFSVGDAGAKGKGLFAEGDIDEGAYLFQYGGERLSLDEYVARFPAGDGRYVASIHWNLYIDGEPDGSGVARWMNHADTGVANVRQSKQTFGPRAAMHFYAARSISAGEELVFDYGSEYWAVLAETGQDITKVA